MTRGSARRIPADRDLSGVDSRAAATLGIHRTDPRPSKRMNNQPNQTASQRMIRLRLLASMLATVARTDAVLIAILYPRGVLG
jgi:hypothetical protein